MARILLTGLLATGLSWHSVSLIDALWGTLVTALAVFPFLWMKQVTRAEGAFLAALASWIGIQGIGVLLGGSLIAGLIFRSFSFLRQRLCRFGNVPAITAGFAAAAFLPH